MRSLYTIGAILVTLMLSNCTRQTSLTLAVSSNLQFAIAELSETFSQSTGIPCQTILSSSGKLTAQIQAGAPYDVLLSADMKYPNALHAKGLTQERPQIYAYGQLVLWTMDQSLAPAMDTLVRKSVSRIAIANPKTAPYGSAAVASLKRAGIQTQVQPKLIYGEAIAQVNQFIDSKAVNIGFTAKSVVLSPQLVGQGRWADVPAASYPPIAQGIAILKNQRPHQRQAQRFRDFLFSTEAREILTRYGYKVNPL